VRLSSCTVHYETSEICVSITVAQYMEKHQKYVSVSSCTIHGKSSEICASI
jgi:hypothetical protein